MTPFPYSLGEQTFVGKVLYPAGAGPHPAVLIFHDGRGIGDFVAQIAARIAALGYVAFAADMFGNGRRYDDDPREGARAVIRLREDEATLRARALAAFAAIHGAPDIIPGRLAAIGYCFGGQCALELARAGAELKAVVSFHAPLGTRSPARKGAVKASILVLTGAQDPFALREECDQFQDEMTEADADWHMSIFGSAKHGFTDPGADQSAETMAGVGYDAFADKFSWAQARTFLAHALTD